MISTKQWPRLVEPALLGVLGLLGLAVLVAAIQGTREWMSTRELHETYTQLTNVRPSAQAVQTSQHEEMVKRLSAHRLIAPPPGFQLTGVLGDAAIFNGGMLVKAGGSAGDMKILSVGPNSVEVSTNGQTQKLYVFQPQMPEPPAPSAMPAQQPAPAERPSSPTGPESPSVRRSVPPLPASKSIAQP